ncbi:hypothetical protein ONZ43_g4147 [Nemania bipapillata]|uniref:Uncharacterized protein n=1 Tax=Nemania bipapillata TaxID=110536 RepID=A0ACC2IR84_9PEZI|nr:hypothetical protein ONZ43_g4147 [Nemania bipapillata]
MPAKPQWKVLAREQSPSASRPWRRPSVLNDPELDFELESQPATRLNTKYEANSYDDTQQEGDGFGDVGDDILIDEVASTTCSWQLCAEVAAPRHSIGKSIELVDDDILSCINIRALWFLALEDSLLYQPMGQCSPDEAVAVDPKQNS